MYYINIDILSIVNYSVITCIQGPLNPIFVYHEMFTKAILEELLVYRYQYGKDLSRNSVEAELMVFQTF